MPITNDDIIAVLRSIDGSLKAILARGQKSATPAQAEIASEAELDSDYGDPVIKAKDPRTWTGEPQQGKRFSQCPPAYLDQLAERYDFFAAKEDEEGAVDAKGRPKSHWSRKDAARARGWAKRLRSGWKPVEEAPLTADDIAFIWPLLLTALAGGWLA